MVAIACALKRRASSSSQKTVVERAYVCAKRNVNRPLKPNSNFPLISFSVSLPAATFSASRFLERAGATA